MPLSIRKSIGRDRRSPVVGTTRTTGIKSSSHSVKKTRRGGVIPKVQIPNKIKRKSLCCNRCGVPLKPTNLNHTSSRGCKCTIRQQRVSITAIKKSKTKSEPNNKIKNNSKKVLLGNYSGDDYKLLNSPEVVISSSFRMLAEAAAMKLRKGARIGEISRTIKESEPEDDESSGDTSSEFEDSSEEEVFEPAKTYPLRKKTRLSTPARNRRISSGSSGSSSESLPDLDFPVDRRWSVPSKDNVIEVKKTAPIVTNGTSEILRRNPSSTILQGTMGSTQSKTARQSPDKLHSTASTRTPVTKPRSLRSADGGSSHDVRSESRGTETTTTTNNKCVGGGSPQKQPPGRPRLISSNSSPDRSQLRPSSSHDAEKSYSLRGLEKKDGSHFITTDSTHQSTAVKETKNEDSCLAISTVPNTLVRRSRGRPRKVPKNPDDVDKAGTSLGSSKSIPLTRSQRRAAHPQEPQASSDGNSVVNSQQGQEIHKNSTITTDSYNKGINKEKERPSFRSQNQVAVKTSRNAIALRARQSKIMAKSRVWQSNRNNSSAWKPLQEDDGKPLSTSIDVDRVPVSSLSENKNLQQARSMLTLMRSNGANKNQLQFRPVEGPTTNTTNTTTTTTTLIKKGYPVAKCDLCNMTFTRRFSLTKHYMTIQHRKMVQQALKSSSEELRALAKSVPVLSRQNRVNINTRRSPAGASSSVVSTTISSSRIPSSSRTTTREISFERNEHHKSECIAFEEDSSSDQFDDNNMDDDPRETISPEPEEEDEPMVEENCANTEPTIVVQEWMSGKAKGPNEYFCEVCQETFTKKIELTTHLWNHREDADLKCNVCEKQFTESDEYNHHIDNAHLVDTKFSCKFCPSKFHREDYLEKHMSSHRRDLNEKFICSVCDKRFSAHNLLSRHFDTKHLQLGRPRVQLACDSPGDQQNVPKIPEYINCDNENDDSSPSSCDEIDPEYRDQMPDIDLEMEDASRTSENEPIPMIAPEDYGRELPVEIFNRYQVFRNKKMSDIDFTRMGPSYKSRLPITYNHQQGEENAERYSCQVCKMRFKFKNHLSRHMLRHLPPVRKPTFLKHRSKLVARKLPRLLPILPNNHDLTVRPQERPREISSTSKPTLSIKFETPTTIEPNLNMNPPASKTSTPTVIRQIGNLFACELCSETFTEKQTLSVHTWFHQKENVYSCPDCDARCERKSDLDLHSSCHETQQPFFLCYVCFKPFRWKKDMIRHVRKKHPAERTYRCLYCPERFRKNDELSIHISKRHPEHRSFPCEYCGRRYAQKRYLLVHIQTQHGIEPVAENIHQISLQPEDDDEEVEEDNIFLQNDQL